MASFFQQPFFSYVILHNSIQQYCIAVSVFFVLLIVLFVVQKIIMRHFTKFAQKTKTEIDDVIVAFIKSIKPGLYGILSLYCAVRTLYLAHIVQDVFNILIIVVVIIQITRSLQIIVEFIAKKLSGNNDDAHTKSAAHLLSTIMIIVAWVFGVLMILANIGVNISSLIAGVGISGIAIAFAVKEVLSDLFASFSIYFDKPFKVGDVVKVDDSIGTVKEIGIKTTRIESRGGEELVISNYDMTSSRVHNYKKMTIRNAQISVIVSFNTTVEQLKEIPLHIKNIIDEVDHAQYRRAHIKEICEKGFVIETAYKIDCRDFMIYMDAQQKINLDIIKYFNEKNIRFAEPWYECDSK